MLSKLPLSPQRLPDLHTALAQPVCIAITAKYERCQGFCLNLFTFPKYLSHTGSKYSQHLSPSAKILLRIYKASLCFSPPRRLSDLCRHPGCIHTFLYLPGASTFPAFCCGLTTLPVCCPFPLIVFIKVLVYILVLLFLIVQAIKFHLRRYSEGQVLSFFESELDQHPGMIKGQILALVVFLQRPLVSHSS